MSLSPPEKRERLVASYVRTYGAQGIQVDTAALEKAVVADCELVDAADRAGELRGGGVKDPSPSQPRQDVLAEAQRATGTRLTRDRGPGEESPHRYKPAVLHQPPQLRSPRYAAAVARIRRIIEGIAPAVTFAAAVKGAEYPELAHSYLELYAFYMTRSRPAPPFGRPDHNPFRGLSDRDAARLWEAKLYEICDRSTGVLNHWYVK